MKTNAVVLLIASATGCSHNADVGKLQQSLDADPAQVKLMACSDLLLATQPIKPASELDYIGLYQQVSPSSSDYVVVLSDHGEACRGAKDQEACVADMAARWSDPPTCSTPDLACKPFVITTRGSDVRRYTSPEQLARVLGRVDTASEAVLMAQLYGLYVTCNSIDNQPAAGTLVQATGSGWRVQSQSSCGGSAGLQSIEIHEDGSSPGLERNLDSASGPCVPAGG